MVPGREGSLRVARGGGRIWRGGPHRLAAAAWLGAGDTEVIDLVAVVECGEESHVAAPSPSFSSENFDLTLEASGRLRQTCM